MLCILRIHTIVRIYVSSAGSRYPDIIRVGLRRLRRIEVENAGGRALCVVLLPHWLALNVMLLVRGLILTLNHQPRRIGGIWCILVTSASDTHIACTRQELVRLFTCNTYTVIVPHQY